MTKSYFKIETYLTLSDCINLVGKTVGASSVDVRIASAAGVPAVVVSPNTFGLKASGEREN